MLTIAMLAIVAAWLGALLVVAGLCLHAARGDRELQRPSRAARRFERTAWLRPAA